MSKDIKVLYVQNSALLFRSEHGAVLIDGLVNDANWFSRMPDELEKRIITGGIGFSDIKLLMYTHGHMDHYDAEKTSMFQSFHKETVILGPTKWCADGQAVSAGDFTLRVYETKHVAVPGFPEVPHKTILIEAYGKTCFIGSDMDVNPVDGELQAALEGIPLQAAFFNPLILSAAGGREWLRKISPTRTYIYHLPPQQNDYYHYRDVAAAHCDKYAESLPPVTLLLDPMTELKL